ncbi:dual specificity protein phosphatase family protein [Ralstonia sp. ASV6]|uniref:dual specificity protein phosphatase family protein n=1 Tax=Ralstonia sp. ASV6 TaxID=2795124 RepID=UPI0018EBF242|nr:dual specificity protein phosphatase family protein [Ralstonia sp. ASV6]
MPQRLHDIVGRLYRPPADGIRQVFALSRADAERLPALPSIAIISVTAPERPPANISGFAHMLRLRFADVDFLKPDLSARAKEKLPHAFTAEQGSAIRGFVEALPDEISSVVVHCEGGYSRSAAITLALHKLYGYHVELQHLTQANPSIIRMLTGDVRGHHEWKNVRR